MFRKSIIISLSSYKLSLDEKRLLKNYKPWGVILFKRNIKSLTQIRDLTSHIKDIMNDRFYPIMVDEEGGKVSRFSNIIKTEHFPQKYFGKLFEKDKKSGIKLYTEYLDFTCKILIESGININTIPVLDILKNHTHNVIGNRSYSKDLKTINALRDICFKTLDKLKIACVSKHIPGHGESKVDTHKKLSVVSSSLKSLSKKDFKAFNNIQSRFAMTAHIIYNKIDKLNPATHSKILIREIIRERLGYKGIIISDDISMNSLKGNLNERAQKAINAGCNLILYCRGNFKESTKLLRQIDEIDAFTKKKTSEFYNFLR